MAPTVTAHRASRADRPVLPGYLLHAVQRGEVKKVRNWLLRGGSVDAQCTELTGYSLLHAAAVYELREVPVSDLWL